MSEEKRKTRKAKARKPDPRLWCGRALHRARLLKERAGREIETAAIDTSKTERR
jgi:hypothetical protein